MKTCFFIGHNKLPSGDERNLLIKQLDMKIDKMFSKGCGAFIANAVFDFNALAARRIIDFKKNGAPIKLIIVQPFRNYEKRKNRQLLPGYEQILENADEIIYAAQGGYSYWYYALDNVSLEKSDCCIAFVTWSDYKVMNMLSRADKKKMKIEVLDMVFNEQNGEFL